MKRRRGNLAAVAVVALLAFVPAVSSGQDNEEQPKESAMTTGCQGMTGSHRMSAEDSKLDELIETMNASEGDAWRDAATAVIEQLVSERERMGHGMMDCAMMQNMMGHMHGGDSAGVSGCPMSAGGGEKSGSTPSPSEHETHHG